MALLFALHLLNFLPWWVLALKSWLRNLPFLLASVTLFQFTWVSPCWLYANGIFQIAGIPYEASYPEALSVYLLGVGVFNTTWLSFRPSLSSYRHEPEQAGSLPRAFFLLLASIVLLLALMGYHMSGYPFWKVLNPFNSDPNLNLYGMAVRNPVLEGFADTLVPASALALLGGGPAGILLFLISCWVLLLSGFRFRLILLALSLGFYWLIRVHPKHRTSQLGLALLVGGIGLAVLTTNRSLIVSRRWSDLGLYLNSVSPALLVNETNNCQTFMACLASPHRESLVPDGGMSIVGASVVRFLPAAVFPNNKKPVANTIALIRRTYLLTPESRKLSPALSCLEELYLSAGLVGLVFGMGFWGAFSSWAGGKIASVRSMPALFGNCLAGAVLFQVISRGYVPQQAELAVFLSLPFAAVYLYRRYGPIANRHQG